MSAPYFSIISNVLVYITVFVAISLFIVELICLPVWVGKIDVTKNKKKPMERYLENRLILLEGRIVLTVVLCAAVSIISFLFGSFPREIKNPGFLLFIPVVIWLIGTGLGGVILGQYLLNTARKSEIYKKTDRLPTVFIRNRSQYGMGLIISFYLSGIVSIAMMHLLFVLNII